MYHQELSKQEARREAAMQLAVNVVEAALWNGTADHNASAMLLGTAAEIDRFLEGTQDAGGRVSVGVDAGPVVGAAVREAAESGTRGGVEATVFAAPDIVVTVLDVDELARLVGELLKTTGRPTT